MEFNFDETPGGDAGADISIKCRRQLLPFVQEIAQAAVTAGWNQKDVLLAIVDLAWDLYEKQRDDR
ncbi:hypothetical protein [Rhizobium rhizogenes]|uniref:hypothetical protein n=1 Tax=Rhizobium rhizogenes TaxID=359 RepID=UPI0035AC04C8